MEPVPPLLVRMKRLSERARFREIGKGGFAVVYKGMLGNRMVAVKKLSSTHLHENKFHQEVECLMKVKHRNIVRFLGYCADTQGKMEKYNEKFVMADVQQRLLCFEYLPKGSLDKYITDASRGLEWRERYRIIEGICKGLKYLQQNRIVHLDLKPANILLDNDMVPKITDFGLSRCFEEKQSRAIMSKLFGSIGYFPPEFYSGKITFKSDMYSLGIIITEILTGEKGYCSVDDVLEIWRNRLEKSQEDRVETSTGSLEWRKLCMNETYRKRFPDKHFDLETTFHAMVRPHMVAPNKSLVGFFRPESHEDEDISGFKFLDGTTTFDNIWDEIS
ncbi:hypothetical protein ACQ4PT_045172 [Festuca glaucescens]